MGANELVSVECTNAYSHSHVKLAEEFKFLKGSESGRGGVNNRPSLWKPGINNEIFVLSGMQFAQWSFFFLKFNRYFWSTIFYFF